MTTDAINNELKIHRCGNIVLTITYDLDWLFKVIHCPT